MKTYPSIPRTIVHQPIYAFDKLDGSNIRAEWTRKTGFSKFGKRHHLLDDTNPMLKESIQLITEKYTDDLSRIFVEERWMSAVCFFEFFGPNSFAGNHADEPHDVVLLDVAAEKRGIIEPRDFIKKMKVHTAPLLYHGNPNDPFVEEVTTGVLEGMTFEGVVCKGSHVSPGLPLMFKVKNTAWIQKVKDLYAGDDKLIETLV